jgi:tight adherence protein B
MTRRLAATLVCAVAVLAGSAPSAGAAGLDLTPTRGTRFPDRAYVLTLPTSLQLAADSVEVRENGERVRGLVVTPAALADARDFGVVLAIDTSDSMRGGPIRDAVAAARAFAARRAGTQQLAIVTFDGATRVLLPFTTDAAAIDRALATIPPLSRGTHVFDGARRSLDLLAAAGIRSGSVVVLSDGADTGSAAGRTEVIAAARGAHVRIFSVGLRSHRFAGAALEALARGADGRYSEVTSSADLEAIYAQLGAALANEYIIRYRSHAGAGARVSVNVRVPSLGSSTTLRYRTPVESPAGSGIFHEAFWTRFWMSRAALALVTALCAALAGMTAALSVRRRGPTLRERMAEFVSLRRREPSKPSHATLLSDKVTAGARRRLEGKAWWTRLKEELEIAEFSVSAEQLLVLSLLGATLLGWLVMVATGVAALVLAGAVVPLVVRRVVSRKLARRRRAFAEQLPDNLQVLASALRAGHSLSGAISVMVEDSPEPSRSEFRRVIADEQLGVLLEDALDTVVRRMRNEDLAQIALVAALQRHTGGNTAEVLDRVTDTVRERFALRRLVQTLTAQGRISRWILSALPLVLAGAIALVNRDFLRPLVDRTAGIVLVSIAAALSMIGSLIIKRMMDIKV